MEGFYQNMSKIHGMLSVKLKVCVSHEKTLSNYYQTTESVLFKILVSSSIILNDFLHCVAENDLSSDLWMSVFMRIFSVSEQVPIKNWFKKICSQNLKKTSKGPSGHCREEKVAFIRHLFRIQLILLKKKKQV